MTAAEIATELRRYRFARSSEEELQAALAEVLAPLGFAREVHLAGAGRIDFFHPEERVGVEVKVEGGPGAVIRQLDRYAHHVEGLVLVTTRAAHRLLTIPGECPLEVVHVGGGL